MISEEFRDALPVEPRRARTPSRGRAFVFDGPEDYNARIDDESLGIDEFCVLVMRGAGPIGYPGGAEVVNMRPPAHLLKSGIHALPCIGDGRQSGTSGSPSILNASPEAADGGGLALLQTGDRIRVDLNACTADMLVSDEQLATRRAALGDRPFAPESQTPWQEIFRDRVRALCARHDAPRRRRLSEHREPGPAPRQPLENEGENP